MTPVTPKSSVETQAPVNNFQNSNSVGKPYNKPAIGEFTLSLVHDEPKKTPMLESFKSVCSDFKNKLSNLTSKIPPKARIVSAATIATGLTVALGLTFPIALLGVVFIGGIIAVTAANNYLKSIGIDPDNLPSMHEMIHEFDSERNAAADESSAVLGGKARLAAARRAAEADKAFAANVGKSAD